MSLPSPKETSAGRAARRPRVLAWLGAALALATTAAGCSLGNLSPDACEQSGECVALFGAGSECVNGYCSDQVKCTDDADCAAGTCRGGFCAVGSCEGAVSGRPCFACAPETRTEFLNACTNATCVPFDKARITKLPPDGTLPPVP
jgi:hypothetical protein